METRNILEVNIYDKVFKNKFLVVGSCIKDLYPRIFRNFQKKWGNIVEYCLERNHYNILFAKLTDIIALSTTKIIGNTKIIGFLTVNESPHCVQMHYASKYLRRISQNKILFEHFVINPNKEIFKVKIEDIDNSKNFSRIGKLILKY